MKILLDHNVPRPLRNHLPGHQADTAADRNWEELRNGEPLDQAESDGYQLLITADRKMPFQQNFVHRNINVLILTTNAWPVLRQHIADINQAVNSTGANQVRELDVR